MKTKFLILEEESYQYLKKGGLESEVSVKICSF